MEPGKRVLIAPLDWGLGHATRCIPVIRGLLNHNCEVLIAGHGDSLALLQDEFPSLKSFGLPGYNPVYPTGGSMAWKMAFQLPKFIRTIAQEHMETERIVATEGIDLVISDNRYGCFSKKVKSVFIAHQLKILMPPGYKWIEKKVNDFSAAQIKQYAECWVPVPDIRACFIPELTGIDLALPVKPIGYLSRFEPMLCSKKYDVLAVCSGPEPQRTLLEELLAKQLQFSKLNYLIARGKPNASQALLSGIRNNVVDFMNTSELNNAIESSETVIARSGYSTVMDLARLGKKAIFIPTPGQTEQEYIAAELKRQKIAFYMPQREFDLKVALKESLNFNGFAKFEEDNSLLKKAIAGIC